jgi:hypothetical protein
MAKNKSRKSLRKIQKSKNKTYRKKFTGGYGVSNFSELSTKHYYSPNNYNNDPNNPSTMLSGRLTPIIQQGGNRRSYKNRKNSRRQKGGNSILSFGIPSNNNFYSNFGTTNGALGGYNIMRGVQNMDRNTNSQNVTFTNKI